MASFFFIFVFPQLKVKYIHSFLPITGFVPLNSSYGSDCSINWATTTAKIWLFNVGHILDCLFQYKLAKFRKLRPNGCNYELKSSIVKTPGCWKSVLNQVLLAKFQFTIVAEETYWFLIRRRRRRRPSLRHKNWLLTDKEGSRKRIREHGEMETKWIDGMNEASMLKNNLFEGTLDFLLTLIQNKSWPFNIGNKQL